LWVTDPACLYADNLGGVMTRQRFDRTPLAILVVVCACSAPVFAQPRAPQHEATAEFAFVGTSGNSSTQAIGLRTEFTLRRALWIYNGNGAYVRNETEDALKAESFAALFQASGTINARMSQYGRYAYLRNTFAGVQNRNSISAGLEYLVVQPERHRLTVNAGIGYANEQRFIGDDLSTAEFLTGSSYRWTISPTANLTDDVGFSVSFADASDWRTANIVALTSDLTTLLSLKVSNTLRHVHAPVAGFKKTDSITSVALVARF
jgi:putative salt-induced outer membrane protein